MDTATNEYAEKVKNSYGKVKDKAKESFDQSMDVAAESGKDWLEYVKEHPTQSMFFGLTIYFALKGLFK
jgi:hypothetical protein